MAAAVEASPASAVEVRFKREDGGCSTSTLARVSVDEVLAGAPVRDFRWYKGRRFYSGWYWSATTGGLVAYESRLELARILLADFDPAVVGIAAQPFQLTGADGSTTRRHVPDLLLGHANGAVTVVDVKPAHRLDDPTVRAVFGWTARVVASRGWAFEPDRRPQNPSPRHRNPHPPTSSNANTSTQAKTSVPSPPKPASP
jgi:hypothetical protein